MFLSFLLYIMGCMTTLSGLDVAEGRTLCNTVLRGLMLGCIYGQTTTKHNASDTPTVGEGIKISLEMKWHCTTSGQHNIPAASDMKVITYTTVHHFFVLYASCKQFNESKVRLWHTSVLWCRYRRSGQHVFR